MRVRHSLLDIPAAVAQLHAGQVIAYPTEAVYGLGCDPRNETALCTLLSLKGRAKSAGFVLIASNFSQLSPWIADVDESLLNRALSSWPGPTTWLIPRATWVSDLVAGRHKTVAVRVTAHGPSRGLCAAFGTALISTSANHSSAEPARSVEEVIDYFGQKLGGILDGPLGQSPRPSEIRDLVSGKVIRQG